MEVIQNLKLLVSKIRSCGGLPLLLTVLLLASATKLQTANYPTEFFHPMRWAVIAFLLVLFVLLLFVVDILDSILKAQNYVDPQTRQVRIVSLWKDVYTEPLTGLIILFLMIVGITIAQDWSEIYRREVSSWYDSTLWQMEAEIFKFLQESIFNFPKLWDLIYLFFWIYILLIFALLYKRQKFQDIGILSIAAVISFFATRLIALSYPTAGPAFYRPDFFNLTGTASEDMQKMVIAYMNGEVVQNGFLPGTMAMPSLHVGLTFLATFFLARHLPGSLWITLPWACLVWTSTVTLGWHYILDGPAGVVVATMSALLSYGVMRIMEPQTNKRKALSQAQKSSRTCLKIER